MKKFLLTRLLQSLLFVFFWANVAQAQTVQITSNNLKYSIDTSTGEATLAGPTSSSTVITDLVIPDFIEHEGEQIPVTAIADRAFSNNQNLRGSLTIGNNVLTIGERAFYFCSGFTRSLTIPNSVQTIGDNAFSLCSGFTGSLTIPDNVQTIGDEAFRNCSGFTGSLTIGENVKSIGEEAFRGCSGFTGSLNIPNSVQSIGNHAFSYCSGFTGSLTISEKVQSIGNFAFSDCSRFTGSLIIPNSVQTIGYAAFSSCRGFTGSLTIGENVKEIYYMAFSGAGFQSVTSLAPIPPECIYDSENKYTYVFYRYNIPLYVPAESIDLYKTATEWKKFTNINPIVVLATDVNLNSEDLSLLVGQTFQLEATVEPENVSDKMVTWKSDNEAVATVGEDGTVTAVSVGTANITATCGEATATCVVNVVALDDEDLIIVPGEGTTEGDEDASDADNTADGGSLKGNDLTLRIGQRATITITLKKDLDVIPTFAWMLGEGGDKYVEMTQSDDSFSATFEGLSTGETSYTISLDGETEIILTGKIVVLDEDGLGVYDVNVDNKNITVYNIQGVLLPVTTYEALNRLPRGFYIVNGKVIFVK